MQILISGHALKEDNNLLKKRINKKRCQMQARKMMQLKIKFKLRHLQAMKQFLAIKCANMRPKQRQHRQQSQSDSFLNFGVGIFVFKRFLAKQVMNLMAFKSCCLNECFGIVSVQLGAFLLQINSVIHSSIKQPFEMSLEKINQKLGKV